MQKSQDEISYLSPSRAAPQPKKRYKIGSALPQAALAPHKNRDVFELFTVKNSSQDTSEASDDVFMKPKPVTASTSSTKSYRDKINERFKSVKERAEKSTKKANVFKETAEKVLLERVRRESDDIDVELELMRDRLKLGKVPEKHEKYEFFFGGKLDVDVANESKEEFESTEQLTQNVQIIYEKAHHIKQKISKSENEILFKPKAEPIEEKINEEPRFLQDEGFYVLSRPDILHRQEYLLEQRLSHDDKKWFDCEGKLNFIENPIKKKSFRAFLKPHSSKETTCYLPAKFDSVHCEEVTVIRDNFLQLQLFSLTFDHHPLFSLEHVLERKLKKLYKTYEKNITNNNLCKLQVRLDSLRTMLKNAEETSSQSGDGNESDREYACKRDIKLLQNKIFEEGKNSRNLTKAILCAWKNLKLVRETNSCANTSTRLIIKKEKVDYHEDRANFDEMLKNALQDKLESRRKRKSREINELREKLLENFKESHRMPGEPILHFSLINNNKISSNACENSKEQTRRGVMESTRIFLKIICNKVEVCKTKAVNLNNDFICNFDETITIQLETVPEFVTIQIIEQPKSLLKRSLAELTIKIPSKTTIKNIRTNIDFQKKEVVHYKHEGVGSGVEIEGVELNTCGALNYAIKWEHSDKENILSETHSEKFLNEIIDRNGCLDFVKLSEWLNQEKPDPQNPKNSVLYEFHQSGIIEKNNFFRLNPMMEEWTFCDFRVLEENLRLKVLSLRDQNEPEFDRMRVPNRIKEIPLNILADYKRRIDAEKEEIVLGDDEDEEDEEVEKKRCRGKKCLKQIHIRVFQKCKNFENNLTFEDVLDEKYLRQFQRLIKAWIYTFIMWFQWTPKSPLTPFKSFKASKFSNYDFEGQPKIVIEVISGLNIPERDDKKAANVYIEIEYKSTKVRTSTLQGPHPNWKEKLYLPLEQTHTDYLNPNSLNGVIIVNVFEEKDKVLAKFATEKSRSWLGSVEVHVSAICSNGIEGMFKVKVPHLLLGHKNFKKNAKQENQLFFLNLNLTIEPNVPRLNPSIEELPCADLPYIREHALKWNEMFNLSYPDRKFSVFAIDTNGATCCIVRYIKALEPPQINVEGFDVTPEQCAKYISLIPFTESNQFYTNIWLPLDRFLHFMIGSIIDHAVALTCFFLALKMEAWLLLGFGLPHGPAAYVLVKEYLNDSPTFYIYDVTLGKKVYFTDPFCSVQKIYCIVNGHNVWANIQRNNNLTMMRFDLGRRSDWLPLFDAKISAPTNAIHGKIVYLPTPDLSDFEIVLEMKIRKKFAKLRQLDRTVWNHHVSNDFKTVLDLYEKGEMYGKKTAEASDKIRDCASAYKMKGHAICQPFINVKLLVKKVQMYGLHLEEDTTVQFASAVVVKGYPNQVLSIWLFLASLKQKQKN